MEKVCDWGQFCMRMGSTVERFTNVPFEQNLCWYCLHQWSTLWHHCMGWWCCAGVVYVYAVCQKYTMAYQHEVWTCCMRQKSIVCTHGVYYVSQKYTYVVHCSIIHWHNVCWYWQRAEACSINAIIADAGREMKYAASAWYIIVTGGEKKHKELAWC